MKLVIVSPYYAPAWTYGGPPRVLHSLAKELAGLGQQVTVITTDALDQNRNPRRREMIDGVTVIRLPNISNWLVYRWKLFYAVNLVSRTRSILEEADVVLLGDIRSFLNVSLTGWLIARGKRYGIFAFGQIPLGQDWRTPIKWLIDRLWIKRLAANASWLFAQTEHERREYGRAFGAPRNKTQLVVLPVDLSRRPDSKGWKKKIGLNSTNQVILFVGRWHPGKGGDRLIEAVAPLLRADSELFLVFVGRDDGAENTWRSTVTGDIAQQVIFAGPLYEQAVYAAYRDADVFAFTPTYYEETTTAGLEALACGTPVVVTEQAEIPYLEAYNAGYIVKNQPAAIRRAILRLLALSPTQKKQTSRQAQRLIREKYAASVIARRIITFTK